MSVEVSYLAAFLVGLFGGVHCVGMCGGIVGALSFGLSPGVREGRWGAWPYLAAYNVGRITSYALAGAIMGGAGVAATGLLDLRDAQLVLEIVAGLFMIALGLYLAGWWFGLARLERAGAVLWRRLEPVGRRLLPVRTPRRAFVLGLVWGWLPCGLVYSALIWAISAGSALHGAFLMLSFGMGTLPNLMVMGFFASRITTTFRRPVIRVGAGLAVILFGLLAIGRALFSLI